MRFVFNQPVKTSNNPVSSDKICVAIYFNNWSIRRKRSFWVSFIKKTFFFFWCQHLRPYYLNLFSDEHLGLFYYLDPLPKIVDDFGNPFFTS